MQLQQQVNNLIETFLEKKFRISRSFATKNTYRASLRMANEFLRVEKNLDFVQALSLIKNKNLDPIDVLDDFYTHLTKTKRKSGQIGYSPQATKMFIHTLKEFFNSHGCRIYNEDVKNRFRLPKIIDSIEDGLDKSTLSRLIRLANYKLATVILVVVSSGMRLGEICQLKLSDIDFTKNPTQISIRGATTKTRQPRFTFISSEATHALKDYLVKTKPKKEKDDYVFLIPHKDRVLQLKEKLQKNNHTLSFQKGLYEKRLKSLKHDMQRLSNEELLDTERHLTEHNLNCQLQRLVNSVPELNKVKDNGRKQIHFHAFRYFFKTQVTDAHQSDFAEALMGHKSLKLTYYRQNEKARAKTYLAVEHALTISDTENIDRNYTELQKDNLELRGIVDSLSRQLQNLEKKIIDNCL